MSDRQPLPTCQTCRFWDAVSSSVFAPAGWRSCSAIPDRYDAGRVSLAVTCEDDDRSFILTSPDFGCVMHQPATVAEHPAPGA